MTHCMELADGTRGSGVAERKGDAEVILIDNIFAGHLFRARSNQCQKGATVVFIKGKNFLKHRNGTRFNIHVYNGLYYLNTVNCDDQYDQCNECRYLQTWHEILGRCNYDGIQKLQSGVDGMKIKGKPDKSALHCDVCTEGKFVQTRNRDSDIRPKTVRELVRTDLAGP